MTTDPASTARVRGGRFFIAFEDGTGRIGVIRGRDYRLGQVDISDPPPDDLPLRVPRVVLPPPAPGVAVTFDDVQGGLDLRYVDDWAAVGLPSDAPAAGP